MRGGGEIIGLVKIWRRLAEDGSPHRAAVAGRPPYRAMQKQQRARGEAVDGRRHAEMRVILSVISKGPPQNSFRCRPHHCAVRHIFE